MVIRSIVLMHIDQRSSHDSHDGDHRTHGRRVGGFVTNKNHGIPFKHDPFISMGYHLIVRKNHLIVQK